VKKERRRVPPGQSRPHASSPAPHDVRGAQEQLGRALREGLNKVADSLDNALAGSRVTGGILKEVGRQEREWGVQSWPEGTGPETRPIEALGPWHDDRSGEVADAQRRECHALKVNGHLTWWDILLEEVLEAAAERPDLDNQDLDKELTQAAAVIVSWLKDRERRRETARRKREEDLATVGYDTTEGPQPETDNPDQAGALERAGVDPDELERLEREAELEDQLKAAGIPTDQPPEDQVLTSIQLWPPRDRLEQLWRRENRDRHKNPEGEARAWLMDEVLETLSIQRPERDTDPTDLPGGVLGEGR
jgi:hypothetical protein